MFARIETFMLREARAVSVVWRIYRTLFVHPRQTEELVRELETEIHAFLVCAGVSTGVLGKSLKHCAADCSGA